MQTGLVYLLVFSSLFQYDNQALTKWLLELVQQRTEVHKRNSEIINSILGLPKNLNEAGRR